MNIEKSNTEIGKFMGWEVSDSAKSLQERNLTYEEIPHGYFKIHPNDLKFDTSWEWLMPVVEKIESLFPRVAIVMYPTHCTIEDESYADLSTPMENRLSNVSDMFENIWEDGDNRRDAAYKAVVEFIKWYNKNK